MNYIVLWNGKKREFTDYGEALSTAFDYTYQYHRCTTSKKTDTAIIISREVWSVKLVTFYDVEGIPNWNVTEIIQNIPNVRNVRVGDKMATKLGKYYDVDGILKKFGQLETVVTIRKFREEK